MQVGWKVNNMNIAVGDGGCYWALIWSEEEERNIFIYFLFYLAPFLLGIMGCALSGLWPFLCSFTHWK
jgi:hypothetical protein